jgi:ubiquinone/menaquinone biosynthesis C-methylase UbiE
VWQRHHLVERLLCLPGWKERLEGGCSVADVGCGCGEAAVIVAAAFPKCRVTGYDTSERALQHARAAAKQAGATNVEFVNPGREEKQMPGGEYDLVMTHDAIHDMSRPLQVMHSVRSAIKPDGAWVIGDMSAMDGHGKNVKEHPAAALLYGFSCFLCLPSALEGDGAAGLGTLGWGEKTARNMLKEAGFGTVEVLENWGHPLNRYYLARP